MPDLDQSFAALADPTRRAILARLAEGEATVQDLARPFAISQPAISKLAVVGRQVVGLSIWNWGEAGSDMRQNRN